jgi:hypothetical protein
MPIAAGTSPHKSMSNVFVPRIAEISENADAVTVVQLPPLGDMKSVDTQPPC